MGWRRDPIRTRRRRDSRTRDCLALVVPFSCLLLLLLLLLLSAICCLLCTTVDCLLSSAVCSLVPGFLAGVRAAAWQRAQAAETSEAARQRDTRQKSRPASAVINSSTCSKMASPMHSMARGRGCLSPLAWRPRCSSSLLNLFSLSGAAKRRGKAYCALSSRHRCHGISLAYHPRKRSRSRSTLSLCSFAMTAQFVSLAAFPDSATTRFWPWAPRRQLKAARNPFSHAE